MVNTEANSFGYIELPGLVTHKVFLMPGLPHLPKWCRRSKTRIGITLGRKLNLKVVISRGVSGVSSVISKETALRQLHLLTAEGAPVCTALPPDPPCTTIERGTIDWAINYNFRHIYISRTVKNASVSS